MITHELPPQAQLMQFIVGKWISKPLYVAAELGIADMLQDGPKDIATLAQMTGTHAPSLYRVMRALACVGIFTEKEQGWFALTPMAECLKEEAMRPIALMFNADWNDKAWAHLLDAVRSGGTPFEKAHGIPISQWLATHPEAAELLNAANAVKAAGTHRAIVEAYDFEEIATLTDVGGGTGTLMAEILLAYPSMRGVVAELPSVVPEATRKIQALSLRNRCTVVACDFFTHIPSGSDAYMLSHVLHDWPDDRCEIILRNCRGAMKPQSRLLIVEMIIPPGNQWSVSKLLDLEMLVVTGGRERTERQFHEMLAASGFRLSRVVPTRESVFIIEAIRP